MIDVEQIDKTIEVRLKSIPDCFQCAKCTAVCPLSSISDFRPRCLVRESQIRIGQVYSEELIWQCATCNACVDICPQKVNPSDISISLRNQLVEEGRAPQEVNQTLENIYKRNNPWGNPKSERDQWRHGLGFEVRHVSPGTEFLFFVGCAPSYDPRCQKVAKSLTVIFNQAGIEFGILGNDEKCCGESARRLGEEGLFQMLAEENTKLLNEYKDTKVVTISPHCYQAIKNEYSNFDGEVLHYTQLLEELLENTELNLGGGDEPLGVTYQDPCYLGRHNGIYDPPRSILAKLPNVELIEMEGSRERSYCCGGGGR